jgi:hypothetical protein
VEVNCLGRWREQSWVKYAFKTANERKLDQGIWLNMDKQDGQEGEAEKGGVGDLTTKGVKHAKWKMDANLKKY